MITKKGMGHHHTFVGGSIILLAAASAMGTVIRVDPASPTNGNGTNTDWSNAYHSLSSALAVANSGDEVRVAANETYKPASQSSSFTMEAGVVILGGYAGYGAPNPDARNSDPLNNGCVLSGDLDSNGTDAGDCYHVVKAPATGTMHDYDTRLDGFKITSAYANGTGDDAYGGGLLLDNSPLIRNCWIVDNFASSFGGGACVLDGANAPVFRKCTIDDNTASSGGGFATLGSTASKVLDCVIRDNTASVGGGAYALDATEPHFICCTISGNISSDGQGGGVFITRNSGNTSVDLLNCLVINNTAQGVSSFGGGASFNKGLGGVVNCTFAGNSAVWGGAYYQYNVEGGTSNLENCIMWDNGDSEIRTDFGALAVRYCDVNGGASAVSASANGTISYDGGSFATNNINSDPLYVGSGSYRLQCSSPCKNVANNSLIPADTHDVNETAGDNGFATPDRDLNFRIVAFVADMGAYEIEGICCNGDTDQSGAVDVDDLLNVVNGWGSNPSHPGNVWPNPCPDSVVDVNDLLAVINGWGNCPDHCPGDGFVEGGVPQSYTDCQNMCDQYSGQAWQECMQACFKVLCEQGQTEYCED